MDRYDDDDDAAYFDRLHAGLSRVLIALCLIGIAVIGLLIHWSL